jgi:hypothetical protein
MTEVLEKLFWLVLVLNIRHGKALFLALGRPRFFNDLRQVRKNVGFSANQIIADLRNNGDDFACSRPDGHRRRGAALAVPATPP